MGKLLLMRFLVLKMLCLGSKFGDDQFDSDVTIAPCQRSMNMLFTELPSLPSHLLRFWC